MKLTNNQHSHTDIQELTIDSEHLKDQQDIADAFNYYFSIIIDKKKVKIMQRPRPIMKKHLLSIIT